MQRLLAVVMVVGLTAACSGDDDDEAAATTAAGSVVPTTEPSPTTAAPASNTAAPTTAAPTTTTEPPPTTSEPPPTTEGATTTDPPPTTLDPLEDLAMSVARDAQAGEDMLFDVLTDPFAEDAEDRLRVFYADEALESVLGTLEAFRRNDLIVEENPVVADTVELTDEPRPIEGSDPLRVEVGTCRLDAAIVMAPVVDTDLRIPIDDQIYRTDAESSFILVEGTWRLQGGTTLSESTGDVTCD